MSFSSPVLPRPVAPDFSALSLHQIPRPPFIVSMGLRTSASVQQGFHHTNVISSVQPSIAPREQQRGFLDPMARFPGSIPFAQPFSSENALCLRGGKKMNFFPFWSLNPREASPFSNSPAGARCRPGRESPAAHRRPVPGLGGVRSSPPAPTLTFPLRSPHSGAPPPSLSPPPQALPSRGCRGKEGAGKQEGCKSRSEPAVTMPPGPAAPGARDSAAGARCRCGGSCCSCGCGGAGGSGRAVLGSGERGAAAGTPRSHSPHAAARLSRQHSGPPRGPGQKPGRKRGSPGVRAVLASATVPDSSAPVSPSAKRPDQRRVPRASFLLEIRTGSGD